jgi:hypothetical protein
MSDPKPKIRYDATSVGAHGTQDGFVLGFVMDDGQEVSIHLTRAAAERIARTITRLTGFLDRQVP